MNATELIDALKNLPPDSIVEIYDPEAERFLPVAGVVHNRNTKETQLYANGDLYDDEFDEYDENEGDNL